MKNSYVKKISARTLAACLLVCASPQAVAQSSPQSVNRHIELSAMPEQAHLQLQLQREQREAEAKAMRMKAEQAHKQLQLQREQREAEVKAMRVKAEQAHKQLQREKHEAKAKAMRARTDSTAARHKAAARRATRPQHGESAAMKKSPPTCRYLYATA